MLRSLVAVVLAVGGARLVAAQSGDNDRGRHNTTEAVGFVVALIVLLLLCCCVQRRRVAVSRVPKPRPVLPLPMHSDRFPHGIQYGNRYAPPPITAAYAAPVPGSEYPPAVAADYAPPPYVKDADGGGHYAPPPGPPPPPIDVVHSPIVYSPPPGPPPRAHISSNSADFNGGFRPSSVS